MLHGPDAKWSGAREKLTVNAERIIVMDALANGKNVIVDDTNLLGSGTARWQDLARISNADFTVKDFTIVPIAECIRRDALRAGKARVGRGVIERMALQAGLIDLSLYDRVAVVDIDGTLSCLDHRLSYLDETPKNYDKFFDDVVLDSRFDSIWNAVRNLHSSGHTIIVLSGRTATCGYDTNEWLNSREYATEGVPALPFSHLLMRRSGDRRPDNLAKRELMQMMFTAGFQKDAIKIIIDDRESVCEVWRELGLPLVQVDHGAAIQIHPNALKLAVEIGIPIKF